MILSGSGTLLVSATESFTEVATATVLLLSLASDDDGDESLIITRPSGAVGTWPASLDGATLGLTSLAGWEKNALWGMPSNAESCTGELEAELDRLPPIPAPLLIACGLIDLGAAPLSLSGLGLAFLCDPEGGRITTLFGCWFFRRLSSSLSLKPFHSSPSILHSTISRTLASYETILLDNVYCGCPTPRGAHVMLMTLIAASLIIVADILCVHLDLI